MASPNTAKPATAAGEPASNIDLSFPGEIDRHNNQTLIDIQARRLSRRFAISAAMAAIVAPLVFPEASR